MRHNVEHLRRAREILSLLDSENISSDENHLMLKVARDLTLRMANSFPAPGLTSNVATTLCGVGLCQELCQRFVLEYCLKHGEQNVGLVFLNDAGKGNHVFAYIGTPRISDDLFIGRGTQATALSSNRKTSLHDFITANPDIIFVDPLLKFADSADQLQPLMEYCHKHKITHIAGVRDYANTLGLVENAKMIKSNAESIAGKIKSEATNPAVAAVMSAVRTFRSQSVAEQQTRNSALFSSVVPGVAFSCEPPPGSYIDEHKKTVVPSVGH